jgi:hypothetical protein
MEPRRWRAARILGLIVVSALVGCGGNDDGEPPSGLDEVAAARLALATVPVDVACLQVVVAGTRMVTRLFEVTAGGAASFELKGLPLGQATFSANAFPVACGMVPTSSPTWISDPVTVTLTRNEVAEVKLTLRRPGERDAGADGPADGAADAAADAAPDVAPDMTPDTAPDVIPDAAPDTAPDAAPDPNVAQKQLTPADSNIALGDALFMYAPTSALVTVRRRAPEASLPEGAAVIGLVYEVDRPLDGALKLPLPAVPPADAAVMVLDAVTGKWVFLDGVVVGSRLVATAPPEVMAGTGGRLLTTFAIMDRRLGGGTPPPPVPACGGSLVGSWTAAPKSAGEVLRNSFVLPMSAGCGPHEFRPVFQATVRFGDGGGYSVDVLRRDQVVIDVTPMCLGIGSEPPAGPPCGTPGFPCLERSCARVARDLTSAGNNTTFCNIPSGAGFQTGNFCDYRCVGDFETGCVCSSYGWPRHGTETGSYVVTGNQVNLIPSFVGGPPGTLVPIGVQQPPAAPPRDYCVEGNVLSLSAIGGFLVKETP